MIEKLRLQNFRCFHDHILPLRPTTIIVGRNNAGKSTIIEALRLISIVVSRYQSLNFSSVPDWLEIPESYRGVSPSLRNLGFNFKTVFHRYGQPPAIITATFDTKHTVSIYIGPEGKIHSVIKNPNGKIINNKSKAKKVFLPKVSTLPFVAPLSYEEKILTPDYVRSTMSTSLAPLHFRNELNIFYEYFDDFKNYTENSWPGLRILELEGQGEILENKIALMVQDGDFVAEVGWMGHGLQMWLQTMWFLTLRKENSTIILDEPDIYMHADLQRKLIRLLRNFEKQIIIATNSIEILSEVEPEEVLIIDRGKKESNFTTSLPAVQQVVNFIGGIHNLQLTRLWNSRQCVFVEGDDFSILKHLHDTLFPDNQQSLEEIPHMSIGGWGGWNYVIGSSLFLKNSGGEEITTYCIFDSDYHTSEEINKRYEQSKKNKIQLHIWTRKEIENYLLIPETIQRIISNNILSGKVLPDVNMIAEQIDKIARELKDICFDAMSTEFLNQDRKSGVSKANKLTREIFNDKWKTHEGRLSIVSGKSVISKLSDWSNTEFGVSFSSTRIVKELLPKEIASEVADVINAIEKNQYILLKDPG
jgi:energy-coupling factor transporter ATP-binding protein EcfA2